MSLLLALLDPGHAACSLELTGSHHVLPGDTIDVTWTGAGAHAEVYLSAHTNWGQAYHLSTVTSNDGHHSWTLPDDLDHRDELHLYVESAEHGARTTECWSYQEVDVAHRVDVGFGVDSLADLTQNATLFSDVMRELTATAPKASNGLPNLTINQVSATGWAQGAELLPVSTVSGPLASIADSSNLMVGLADIPFSPAEASCTALPNTLPADEYGAYGPLDLLLSQRNDGTQHRVGFAPEFTTAMCPDSFDHGDYAAWVEELAGDLSKAKGDISYETGNEPDGLYFFWGNATSYDAKADAAYAGIRAADKDATVTYGGFGSSTVFDTGKVSNGWTSWDDFRATLDDTPDESFSFHLFRNPGFGAYDGGQFEKTWDDLNGHRWPTTDADHVVLSAFDVFGRNTEKDADGEAIESPWKIALEDSSWLTYELAELLFFLHERDIDAVYLWKLMDIGSEGQSGFFDECGNPRNGYGQLVEVWSVIEGGYSASREKSVVTIEGTNGLILQASADTQFSHDKDMEISSCWVDDLDETLLPSGPVGDDVSATWARMDWVVYRNVTLGAGSPCPSTVATPPTCN
ncbi:MAG TPA: hypothetical protein QGF58_27205 [Myxococcota bacterium]|nr:hypothetical protein [Myxococcota bacterium]